MRSTNLTALYVHEFEGAKECRIRYVPFLGSLGVGLVSNNNNRVTYLWLRSRGLGYVGLGSKGEVSPSSDWPSLCSF